MQTAESSVCSGKTFVDGNAPEMAVHSSNMVPTDPSPPTGAADPQEAMEVASDSSLNNVLVYADAMKEEAAGSSCVGHAPESQAGGGVVVVMSDPQRNTAPVPNEQVGDAGGGSDPQVAQVLVLVASRCVALVDWFHMNSCMKS